MKVCPECRTKNDDVSNFCKKCGFLLSHSSFNACNTEWSLETLKGIKGGCVNYPPEVIPSTVEKDRVLIEEKIVLDWKPRT